MLGNSPKLRLFAAIALVAGLVVAPQASQAQTADSNTEPHSSFSVAGPTDVVTGKPGTTVSTAISITNNTAEPTTYDLSRQALLPQDEGKIQFNTESDPVEDSATFAPTVSVLGNTTQSVPISIAIPDDTETGTRFVGVIVSTQPPFNDMGTTNQLRLLMYVVLDVNDGNGSHGLETTLYNGHKSVFGTKIVGRFSVYNSGTLSSTFSQTAMLDRKYKSTEALVTKPVATGTQLLPSHHRKSYTFTWKGSDYWPTIAHAKVEVVDRTTPNAPVTHTFVGQRTILVPPIFIVFVIIVLLLVVALILRWRLVRRQKKRRVAVKSEPELDDTQGT